MFNLKEAYISRIQKLKSYSENIKYDVDKFKVFLLIFCMLYVQCIILLLVLTAAACGVYQSNSQKDGSLALYALAVTEVNVILIMLGTAVFGLYAALKLSRFVLACHGIGLCSVIILKFMLAIPFFIAINGAVEENTQNLIKIFESQDTEMIAAAQHELECCGLKSYRDFSKGIPDSCCQKSIENCVAQKVYVDGCIFKIGQMTRVPAIVTGVSMILMCLLECVGLAITYGLVKGITLKHGVIDFRAMFKEKLEMINTTVTKPFVKDGFALNMFEAIKKKAQQSIDKADEDAAATKRAGFASSMFSAIKKSLDLGDGDDDDEEGGNVHPVPPPAAPMKKQRKVRHVRDEEAPMTEQATTTDVLIVQIQNSQETATAAEFTEATATSSHTATQNK